MIDLRYGWIAELDPLSLDTTLAELPSMITWRRINGVLAALEFSVEPAGALTGRGEQLAALRDLDFLLCAAHHLVPGSYQGVWGLEAVLCRIGAALNRVPRGDVLTYSMYNPTGDRTRTFTGLPEEHRFIEVMRNSLGSLDEIVATLHEMSGCPPTELRYIEGATRSARLYEGMVEANRVMHREMPPDLFSGRIVPFLGPLRVGGAMRAGITGAGIATCAIDWMLFGVDAAEQEYRDYAAENIAALPEGLRMLTLDTVIRLEGRSLLTVLEDHQGDIGPALWGLDKLLSVILSFRAVHRRLVVANLPLRPQAQGSGGYTLEMLDLLIRLTSEARVRVRELATVCRAR